MCPCIHDKHWSNHFDCFQVVSLFSITFIIVSTIGMTINTIPSLQGTDEKGNPTDNSQLAMVEAVCITWFTIEYILRLAGKDDPRGFFDG